MQIYFYATYVQYHRLAYVHVVDLRALLCALQIQLLPVQDDVQICHADVSLFRTNVSLLSQQRPIWSMFIHEKFNTD